MAVRSRKRGKLVRFGAVELSPEMARRAQQIIESIECDARRRNLVESVERIELCPDELKEEV
jgi:predicted O-methyltransferase YrrM